MNIAFVAVGNPLNTRAWSGTPYFALRELRRRYGDIHVINTPWLDRVVARARPFNRFGIIPRELLSWLGSMPECWLESLKRFTPT